MQKLLKSLIVTAVACCFLMGLASTNAADKKVDPTGTWKWSFTMGDNTINQTLKLKMEGDKLTGTMVGGRNATRETPIEDAKLKGNEITFQVTRERNGEKFASKYKGTIEDDTIKGNIESNFGGQSRTREWIAKKEK